MNSACVRSEAGLWRPALKTHALRGPEEGEELRQGGGAFVLVGGALDLWAGLSCALSEKVVFESGVSSLVSPALSNPLIFLALPCRGI